MKITQIARALRPQLGKPGLSTARACTVRDILVCVRESARAKKRVRVYSRMGFLPNKYKWRATIQYIEARRDADGQWRYFVGKSSAQRSGASGALVVVQ